LKKIALAGMGHESNTFNKLLTGLETFQLMDGNEFRNAPRMGGSADGIYKTLSDAQMDVVPLFFARSIPSGAVRLDAYEYIKSRILEKLSAEGPFDGICLSLHGSMAVEGVHDPEGDLLEAIRWVVGYEIPITCALDMHATVTERMVLLSNGYSVFRTAPHIDAYETGVRAAHMMQQILETGRKTVNTFLKIPILVSGEQSETRVDPAKTLFESLFALDTQPDVLCANYVMGFPWADSPFGGAGALVTGWADAHEDLLALTSDMAQKFWDQRAQFTYSTPALMPTDAVLFAKNATEYPVILSDSADNPTAGASQDTTRFLQLMIEHRLENAVYTCVADPAAYKVCAEHQIGDVISFDLGGFYSGKAYERFHVRAKLLNLATSGGTHYAVLEAMGMGQCAEDVTVFENAQKKSVVFTVSHRRCATYSPETLKELGLDPASFNTIGIKAGYLSPEYQAMSKQSILALTEGDTALELRSLPYVKTPRPMYPLDLDMVVKY